MNQQSIIEQQLQEQYGNVASYEVCFIVVSHGNYL